MENDAPHGEPWAGLWTWTKGKQGDWLVRGPWKCPYCEGSGIYFYDNPDESPSHNCTFCAGTGDIQPPYNVTVTSKAGNTKKVALRLRLWKHATDNVALWSIYDSKPAKPWPSKWKPKPDIAAHNAKLAKEILEHPATKAAQDAIKASKLSYPSWNTAEAAFQATIKEAKAVISTGLPHDLKIELTDPIVHAEIFSSEPLIEPFEPVVDEFASSVPYACSNCGASDKPKALQSARDCDGLRGFCCPKCLTLSVNERDFG